VSLKRFSLVSLKETLCMTGIHSGQDSERKFRTAGGTRPLASIAELIEALAHLLRLEQGKPDLRAMVEFGDEVGGGVSSVIDEVTDGGIRHGRGYRGWAAGGQEARSRTTRCSPYCVKGRGRC
jgi:hypothetical protein